MPVMYVDDSGSSGYRDNTKYFVLSGVIVEDNKIKALRKNVFDYQQSYFIEDFIDSEIHVHDLYHSRDEFTSLDLATKIEMLNHLYDMISKLDCIGLLVIVNKERLRIEEPTWTPFEKAWLSLLEKYGEFLDKNSIKFGHLKVDKSSNKTQDEITRITRKISRHWTTSKQNARITQPVFVNSSAAYGVQVADAFAYCTLKHKMNDVRFARFWDIIHCMLWKDDLGRMLGYGYNEYPK